MRQFPLDGRAVKGCALRQPAQEDGMSGERIDGDRHIRRLPAELLSDKGSRRSADHGRNRHAESDQGKRLSAASRTEDIGKGPLRHSTDKPAD